MALNTELDNVKKYVAFPAIPDYISDNLSYELREYQKEALSRFLFYYGNYSGEKSPHLLWQMATGSGKTLIMAALILEMYKRGYRNFWFFVTSTDIITKTIDNFTNAAAKKYQFAQKIEIDGKQIEIRQVENFTNAHSESINIKFSTINILHQISQPELISENSVTLEDFADMRLVLIGDEAHHLNAATKKEQEDESTWENSVQLLLNTNKENRLFEFTATANLNNQNIAKKYENKLIYNYDLKHFRNDKFSKDVFTFTTDGDIETIMLRSVLISQYRKHIAADNGISLKPVILFKSQRVAESKENFERFKQLILNLNAETIEKEFNQQIVIDDIWNKTQNYFCRGEISFAYLYEELKLDFAIDTKKVLLHDGTNNRIADQPKLLATLENEDNPVRAIFAVNMLQEGWDVLNLFDIVRLYDTRDGNINKWGKYVAGTGTVSEAQLIGRGARYFPFPYLNADKYKRKFDDNETMPLRAIEQMHYHSKHNPRYISEIRQVLVESGIMAGNDLIEITLKMKQDFIDGKHKAFQEKNLYVNQKTEKGKIDFNNTDFVGSEIKEQQIALLPDFSNDDIFEIKLLSDLSRSQSIFTARQSAPNTELPELQPEHNNSTVITLSQVAEPNIIRHALNSNKNFTFNKLKLAYPKLESMSEFIEKLGEKKVKITANKKITDFTPDDKLFVCKEVLNAVDSLVKEEQKQFIVSKQFLPQKAGERFKRKIIRKYSKDQKQETFDYDWYVYVNSVLTSEEQSFVKWFADNMMTQKQSGKTELEERGWTDIFLARNEKAVILYSWFTENLGGGFEPDFVLLMKKNNTEYVFYIEPKGEHIAAAEQWKEKFLLEIESVVETQQTKEVDNKNWRLIGLPFYNENNKKTIFAAKFKEYI